MGYARKDVEATKKYQKKFVRYQEGAEKYSLGLTKFQALAKMGRPKLPNTKKKVLSIRVSDQLYAQLLAYAEKHKMTTTDVVLRGVETFISRQD